MNKNRYTRKNRIINAILVAVLAVVLCITALVFLQQRNVETPKDFNESIAGSDKPGKSTTDETPDDPVGAANDGDMLPGANPELQPDTDPGQSTQIPETSDPPETPVETQTEQTPASPEETADEETANTLSDDQQSPYTTNTPAEQHDLETDAAEGTREPAPDNNEKPLSGMVICIDPGHQGYGLDISGVEAIAPGSSEMKEKNTTGTAGRYTGVAEFTLNLAVGLLLRDKLEKMGAVAVMTITTNEISVSNIERAAIANESNSDMVIRIHADGSSDSSVRGYSILIPGSTYTPDIVEESLRMAQILDSTLKEHVTIPSRGIVTRHDLTGFNWLQEPGILLEMGFMTNQTDDETMQTQEFQESVTDAIAEALIQYRNEIVDVLT